MSTALDPVVGPTIDPEVPDPDDQPLVLGIPLNRIVTFVGPYIALLAGGLATAITKATHVTGIAHDQLASGFASTLVFLVSSGLVWLGGQQWLKGHHEAIRAQGEVAAAAVIAAPPMSVTTSVTPPPVSETGGHPDGDVYDPLEAAASLPEVGTSPPPPLPDLGPDVDVEDPISEDELAEDAKVRPEPEA